MSTPNMSLVLPTDHGSADTWDTILDTVFNLIDAHDHTTGKGVKVPSAALNINADISFTGFSITNLNAVDLAPVPAATVAAFAGALFVNSADNELYYRTIGGSNVKFTNGAALNVATFTGGIGGDYSAVGALEDFDDASDTYRFRQQVATLVRQFAKMSSADLNLFEYKAAGATPVPTNAVTLKSPTALAGSYNVTFPTALPGAAAAVYIDNTGQLSTKPTLTAQVNGSAGNAQLTANMTMGAGGAWTTVAGGLAAVLALPVNLQAGCKITGYTLWVKKTSGAGVAISSQLVEFDGTTNTATGNTTPGTGTETNTANNPGFITLTKTGLSLTVTGAVGKTWLIQFTNGASSAGDIVFGAEVTYQPV